MKNPRNHPPSETRRKRHLCDPGDRTHATVRFATLPDMNRDQPPEPCRTPTSGPHAANGTQALPSPVRFRPDVLLVMASADEFEVFQAVFERDAISHHATRCADDGLQQTLTLRPRVILLDEDAIEKASLAVEFSAIADALGSRLFLLGNLHMARPFIDQAQRIPKPFHYDDLIRKIQACVAKRTFVA